MLQHVTQYMRSQGSLFFSIFFFPFVLARVRKAVGVTEEEKRKKKKRQKEKTQEETQGQLEQ